MREIQSNPCDAPPQVKMAIRMMMGRGTPRNSRSSERMVGLLEVKGGWVAIDHRSRWRPPKVAAKLAMKAPPSSEMNSHSAP